MASKKREGYFRAGAAQSGNGDVVSETAAKTPNTPKKTDQSKTAETATIRSEKTPPAQSTGIPSNIVLDDTNAQKEIINTRRAADIVGEMDSADAFASIETLLSLNPEELDEYETKLHDKHHYAFSALVIGSGAGGRMTQYLRERGGNGEFALAKKEREKEDRAFNQRMLSVLEKQAAMDVIFRAGKRIAAIGISILVINESLKLIDAQLFDIDEILIRLGLEEKDLIKRKVELQLAEKKIVKRYEEQEKVCQHHYLEKCQHDEELDRVREEHIQTIEEAKQIHQDLAREIDEAMNGAYNDQIVARLKHRAEEIKNRLDETEEDLAEAEEKARLTDEQYRREEKHLNEIGEEREHVVTEIGTIVDRLKEIDVERDGLLTKRKSLVLEKEDLIRQKKELMAEREMLLSKFGDLKDKVGEIDSDIVITKESMEHLLEDSQEWDRTITQLNTMKDGLGQQYDRAVNLHKRAVDRLRELNAEQVDVNEDIQDIKEQALPDLFAGGRLVYIDQKTQDLYYVDEEGQRHDYNDGTKLGAVRNWGGKQMYNLRGIFCSDQKTCDFDLLAAEEKADTISNKRAIAEKHVKKAQKIANSLRQKYEITNEGLRSTYPEGETYNTSRAPALATSSGIETGQKEGLGKVYALSARAPAETVAEAAQTGQKAKTDLTLELNAA